MWLHAESSLRHLDRLHTAALALSGNSHDADDLVQEVYLSLLRRPRRVTRGSEVGYLLTMVRNRFVDEHRSARRRTAAGPLDDRLDAADHRDGLRPEVAAEHGEVIAAVGELASPFRETLIAVDVCGLSYREAAAVLDTPVGTVMSRLARARGRVGRQVEGVPAV